MNRLVKRIYKYISHRARKKRNNRKHTVTLGKLLNKIDKEKTKRGKKKTSNFSETICLRYQHVP